MRKISNKISENPSHSFHENEIFNLSFCPSRRKPSLETQFCVLPLISSSVKSVIFGRYLEALGYTHLFAINAGDQLCLFIKIFRNERPLNNINPIPRRPPKGRCRPLAGFIADPVRRTSRRSISAPGS